VEKRLFILVNDNVRANAIEFVRAAPAGWKVLVSEKNRTDEASARFHAMCNDVSKQCLWHGKRRTQVQWKSLFVSGHAIATKEEVEMVPGLENEFLNIRESTAQMSQRRMLSLISYVQAWGDNQGVRWKAPDYRLEENR
jgi:uncharacterized protein YbdZ (MbtH family)